MKARTLPLTRRERRTLREARSYGLATFGNPTLDDLQSEKKDAEVLAKMTDVQRNQFFIGLESFCTLTIALRYTDTVVEIAKIEKIC